MLDVKNLSVTLGGARILEDVSFTAREGQWLMILGPNGAGKSTLVNAISGGVPYTGEVRLDGENVHRMKPRVRARRLGVLSQNHHVSYAFTVEEIVRMGRYAHARGLFSPRSVEDEAHFVVSPTVVVSPQFFGWVAGFGAGVSVSGPPEVRAEMKKTLDRIQEIYR